MFRSTSRWAPGSVGMKADVRIASRPDDVIPGRVVAVNMLPTTNWKEWDENLEHFFVRVRLDQTPPECTRRSCRPTVEFDTGKITDALVIPAEAMAVVDGEQSCYVVAGTGL